MLRLLFVLAILGGGAVYALRGPFQTLLFYAWYAYFRPDTWVWDTALVQSLNISLLIGGFLVIGTLFRGLRGARINRQMVLVLLFLALNVVSTLSSPYPANASFVSLEEFAKAIVICVVIMLVVDDGDKVRKLLLVIGLSLGFEGAKQGWVQLVFSPGTRNMNDVPFLGDNNHVAIGMLMLVPLLGALAATSSKPAGRCLHRFLLAGVLYRAISTYSRGGFLAAGALAGVSWLQSKKKVRLALAGGLLVVVVALAFPGEFWQRMGTIPKPSRSDEVEEIGKQPDDGSIEGRLHFWRTARAMAGRYALLGVGHASFPLAYNDFDTTYGAFGFSRAVHSEWFGVMSELGYPGLVLFVTILLVALADCHRVRRLAARHAELKNLGHYAGAMTAALVTQTVGGTFVTFQYSEMLWHCIAIAAVLRLIAQKEAARLTAASVVEERHVGVRMPSVAASY